MTTQPPESIGEACASAAWSSHGRDLLLRAKVYGEAVDELAKRVGVGDAGYSADDFLIAKRAFDRHLGKLTVEAPGVIEQNFPRPKKRRRS